MSTLRHIPKAIGGGLLLSLLLGGCSSTPYWDAHFGEAVELTKAQQIINPDAGQNPDPVAGVDGRAARESVETYERSFRTQVQQNNPFVIGVGSGSSGGGQ